MHFLSSVSLLPLQTLLAARCPSQGCAAAAGGDLVEQDWLLGQIVLFWLLLCLDPGLLLLRGTKGSVPAGVGACRLSPGCGFAAFLGPPGSGEPGQRVLLLTRAGGACCLTQLTFAALWTISSCETPALVVQAESLDCSSAGCCGVARAACTVPATKHCPGKRPLPRAPAHHPALARKAAWPQDTARHWPCSF